MVVYDMKPQADGRWVWLFAKNGLALPANSVDEPSFFNAHPKIEVERNPETSPAHGAAKLADLTNLNYQVHLVFSQRAREILGPHLAGLGLWIELVFDEAPYWLFWITNVVDALDELRSEIKRFPDGGVMRIARYAFRPENVAGQWLFTLPQRPGSNRLVTQALVDLAKKHQLTGFEFQPLWSSDAAQPVPATGR